MHANARQNRFIIQFFSFFSLFSIGEITLVFLNMLDFFQCTINFNQFKIMSSSRCEIQSNNNLRKRREMAFGWDLCVLFAAFYGLCVVFCTIYDWFGLRFVCLSFFHIPNKWWIFDCFLTLNFLCWLDSKEKDRVSVCFSHLWLLSVSFPRILLRQISFNAKKYVQDTRWFRCLSTCLDYIVFRFAMF